MTDLPTPARALAFGAHPDDIEFGAGGTLAKWSEEGCVVSFVVATDGSKGTWDPDADLTELVATREEEARAAAATIGATGSVEFLGVVDGELENTREIRSSLALLIRRLRPDVLLGHDPWKRYRLHPDHRAAGFIVCDSLVAARDPHFFPEHGLAPHRPDALLLFEADEPDHLEHIGSHHLDAKIAALEAHASQYESTMFIPDADQADAARIEAQRQAFRDRIRDEAIAAGRTSRGRLAETFRFLPTDR